MLDEKKLLETHKKITELRKTINHTNCYSVTTDIVRIASDYIDSLPKELKEIFEAKQTSSNFLDDNF